MKAPVRFSIGVLLVLAVATLSQCTVGHRLRLIRRITASDLPPAGNSSSAANITDARQTLITREERSNSTNQNVPKTLNITEVFSKSTSTKRPLPTQLNITEILDTSATTHRRQRPVSDRTGVVELTTEVPKTNISESQLRSRRPFLRIRTSLERKNLTTTDAIINNQNVTENISGPLSITEGTILNQTDLTAAESNFKSLNNETNSIILNETSTVNHENVITKSSNCTEGCEQKTAANEDKLVVQSNSNANEVANDTKHKILPKDKPQESLTVPPTDNTFSKIVSSSTARVVLQENIHTDILKHLTTASYAHYETDYVLDLDEAENYEAESSPKRLSTKSYDHYDTQDDFNATYTTPNTKRFDEAFARVSEGIRQNLDDITDRSEEYVGGSNEHFSSSEQNERISIDGIPKNDTKVSLQFVNHLNIISNDSATANSRHGDLFVDNGTHVDFQRSSVQIKVEPETSSTVKYIIDDVYSTTRRIITQNDESNSIKEEVTSEEKVVDRRIEGDKSGSDERAAEQRLEASDSVSEEKELDQRLAGAEDELVRVKIDGMEGATETSNNKLLERLKEDAEIKNIAASEGEISSESGTTTRASTQGRGRMFSTERFSSYNNNNTVEQTSTEIVDSKRLRGRQPYLDDITTTYSPRSRVRFSSTSTTTGLGRFSTDAISTSPRSSVIRRPLNRRPTNSSRLGELDLNNEGNDIIANEGFRTTIRRGTVKFGNTRESSVSEPFPIPPTAAAWSLATMKEPGRRTKLQSINATTTRPKQFEDSEAAGSFSKQTTIYNVITPTSDINATLKDKDIYYNVADGLSVLGFAVKPQIKDDSLAVTTEIPYNDVTTIEVPTTTYSIVEEEGVTTHQPDEVTTSLELNDDVAHDDDDDLRFDGISRTTTVQSYDSGKVTTEYENAATTTESYETTRFSRDEMEKVTDEDKEEEGEVTTPVVELVMPEYGVILDAQQGEGNLEDQQDLHGENKNVELISKLDEAKEERIGGTNHDTQGMDVLKANEASVDGVQKEDEIIKMQVDGVMHQGEGGQHGKETDFGITSGSDRETDTTSSFVSPKILGVVKSLMVEDKNDGGESATTEFADAVLTSVTISPAEVDDNIEDDPTTHEVASDVHTFIRVFVEGSMEEFCSLMTIFKKAVAVLLSEGTSRNVTLGQVIIRNIGPDQCIDKEVTNTTTEGDPGQLIPVEMHIVDEKGNYDQQLNDAFPLLWGHKDLDFQLRIRKVDVVDESLAYSGSSNNGAVIAAITISCIGAMCLLILAILLVVMRKRQKKVNYGMRCTPVSLDAYSLDSVSVHGSTRRKGGLRASKRSYGNPAFEDPVSPTHPLNFAGLSNFTTDRDGIEEEFSNIPHVTPKSDELPEGAETKNRYANIIPLPETRVVLSTIGDESMSDYINANYVRGPKKAIKCYIACQAPMSTTVTDFWRMVWEQQCKVIMMLTDLVENGVEKCADYLPPSEVLDCHRLFGDYQVTLKKREVRETYVISTLQLKNMESNSWREITHLWYLSWPNQGVPEEPSSIIAFLIEARSYMKNSSGPSIVHCSPGTGRTGTVLACDLSIREFEQTRLVDVPRCVYRLRKDRAGCVQTRDQYAFIYQVLNLYATKLTGGALDSI